MKLGKPLPLHSSDEAHPAPPRPRSRATDAVRRMILEGVWQSGDRLPPETALAQQMSISRVTLRRALDELEERGFVRREPHRGCIVTARTPHASPLVSRSIIVITDTAELPVSQPLSGTFSEAKTGLLDAVARQGRNSVVVPTAAIDDGFIHQLIQERPQGVVLFAWTHLTDAMHKVGRTCIDAGIPVVAYCNNDANDASDPTEPAPLPFDRAMSDHESGTHKLVHWLHAQGRQRILRVWTGSPRTPTIALHNQGYERACAELNLPVLPPLYIDDLPHRDGPNPEVFQRRTRCFTGYLAQQFAQESRPDALMVVTDCETFNVAAACRLLGLEPNREVLIVGYDNYWSYAPERQLEAAIPAATIDKDNRAIGAALAQLLERRLGQNVAADAPVVQRLPQQLIPLRQSSVSA